MTFFWERPSSEAEDLEPVDCKVEDSGYSIPASPTWSSQGSPTSPVDNPFHGSSLYPLGSGHHASASSSVYASRGAPNEKWPGPNDSMLSPIQLQRQEMNWSPPAGPVLSSGHTMSRRRDSVIQSETWPSIHSQSGRWQGQSHESSPSSNSSSGLYPERSRIRANQLYDDSQQVVPRRDHDSMAPNFPLRYPPHSAGTREGALQRLHWHSRDTPDNARDPRRCNTQSTQNSFSSSPTLPFSQGYHSGTQPTYSSSWTSTDSSLMTPTLHSIAQSPMSYDGSYSSNSASIPSPDEFTNVDGYRDS